MTLLGVILSLLKPLGIEPGKAFEPEARMKQILTDASDVARAMKQAINMAPDLKDVVYYPGTHWEFVLMLNPGCDKNTGAILRRELTTIFRRRLRHPR